MPTNFKDWVKSNEHKLSHMAKHGKSPYFISRNKKIVEGILNDGDTSKYGLKLGRHSTRKEFKNIENHKSLHNYSEEQKQNFKEITRVTGFKQGEFKNLVDVADGNSNYFNDNENCASCVVVHELRMRGFDNITAKPFEDKEDSISSKLSANTKFAWLTTKGKEPEFTKIKGSKDEIIKKIEQATKPIGSRYHLGWDENISYGHIVTLEMTEKGLLIYDPQKNFFYDIDEIITKILKDSHLELLRVDRLLLNTKFLNGFSEPIK